LPKLAAVWAQNANIFAKFFGKNIFKIITSVTDRRNLLHSLIKLLRHKSLKNYGNSCRIQSFQLLVKLYCNANNVVDSEAKIFTLLSLTYWMTAKHRNKLIEKIWEE
jgi:hypothetical protein